METACNILHLPHGVEGPGMASRYMCIVVIPYGVEETVWWNRFGIYLVCKMFVVDMLQEVFFCVTIN